MGKAVCKAWFGRIKGFTANAQDTSQNNAGENGKTVLELSFEPPGWGCIKLSDYLKLEGNSISSPTLQKILIRNNMASKYDRLMRLEEKHVQEGIELSIEQIRLIEKMNPVFKERRVVSSELGELLCQDTKLVGHLSGFDKIYVQAAIDTYGSYGFACIFSSKRPEVSVTLVHNDGIPQYKTWGIDIHTILTDNGREYCGTDVHPYELYLQLNDIEHWKTKVRSPQKNGFVERFNPILKEEFFMPALKKKIYTSIDELQDDLDTWLYHYNYKRPHRGYRNMGKRPFETVKKFIKKIIKMLDIKVSLTCNSHNNFFHDYLFQIKFIIYTVY